MCCDKYKRGTGNVLMKKVKVIKMKILIRKAWQIKNKFQIWSNQKWKWNDHLKTFEMGGVNNWDDEESESGRSKRVSKKMLKSPHNLSKGHRIQDGVIRKVRTYQILENRKWISPHNPSEGRRRQDRHHSWPPQRSAIQKLFIEQPAKQFRLLNGRWTKSSLTATRMMMTTRRGEGWHLVSQQVEVLADEIESLVRLQCEPLRPEIIR